MDIKIIQYEPVHAYNILDRNVREEDTWLSKFPDWEKWAEGWKKEGPAFTLVIDGQIIGCGGVVLLDKNKGEAWTLLSSLFYKHKKTTYKAIIRYLSLIIAEKGLKRVQALVNTGLPNVEACERFLVHLGFKNETPDGMEGYGPNGETVLLFARRC